MGLIDSITGGISKVMDPGGLVGGLAGLAGKVGMDALKSAMQNPGALLVPGGPAMLAFGAVMKQLGGEPDAKGVASFTKDPQTTVREAIQGMFPLGPGIIKPNGETDPSIKIHGDCAVQTPGGFTIAIKGEGNASICIGIPQDSGPTSVKLGGNGRGDLTISFDPIKDKTIELPGGIKIGIKTEPTDGGGKKCGCDLPDGSKIAWEVIKQGGKDVMGLAGIFGKLLGGGLGGVLMGPFGGAIANAIKGALAGKDGQVAAPSGNTGGFPNFGVDLTFNVNRPGVGGTSNTGGGGGTTGTGNAGGATSTSRTSGFSEGDQAMMGAVKNLTGDVEALKKKLADPNLKPEERQQLQFELQQKTQEMSQLISLFSNLLKILSDAANSIIGNIRQ